VTDPQRALQDLLATWEAWSHHAAVTAVVEDAAARGDQDSAAALRTLLTSESPPGVLDAVTAAAELMRLLSDGWGRAVSVALDAGVSWADVGVASGCSADQARAAHEGGTRPKPQRHKTTDDAPAGGWLSTDQVAARVRRHESTVTRAAGAGLLHGHQPIGRDGRPIARSRWTFRPESVDAWAQGYDERAQRRACGCTELQTTAGRRGRSWGGAR
jgi:hypothetical protein